MAGSPWLTCMLDADVSVAMAVSVPRRCLDYTCSLPSRSTARRPGQQSSDATRLRVRMTHMHPSSTERKRRWVLRRSPHLYGRVVGLSRTLRAAPWVTVTAMVGTCTRTPLKVKHEGWRQALRGKFTKWRIGTCSAPICHAAGAAVEETGPIVPQLGSHNCYTRLPQEK